MCVCVGGGGRLINALSSIQLVYCITLKIYPQKEKKNDMKENSIQLFIQNRTFLTSAQGDRQDIYKQGVDCIAGSHCTNEDVNVYF